MGTRRILFSTHGSVTYLPPLAFSDCQMICGPFYADERKHGKTLSLRTEKGEYCLKELISGLPVSERPDLIFVRADASRRNLPRNTRGTGAQTVLVVGDTHHLDRPIAGLLTYALEERFDHILFDYTRQHAHYFVEAGLTDVKWLPGFNVHQYPGGGKRSIKHVLTFVGQIGKYHAQRKRVIQDLVKIGLPLKTIETLPMEAQLVHRESLISLNVSLNGDLNQRVLEIVGAGGLCLTDRLQPQAGLELLFENEKELVVYSGFADLVERIGHYAREPGDALRVAAAGLKRYNENYSAEHMMAELNAILEGQAGSEVFSLKNERRVSTGRTNERLKLFHRIKLYEVVQLLHARRPYMAVHCTAGVDPLLVSDLVDLSRVVLTMSNRLPRKNRVLIETKVEKGQVSYIDDSPGVPQELDLLITTRSDLEPACSHPEGIRKNESCSGVLLCDLYMDSDAGRVMRILESRGFKQNSRFDFFWS